MFIIQNTTHKRLITTAIFAVFFLLGSVFGYSLGLSQEAKKALAFELVNFNQSINDLKQQAEVTYVNPFDLIKAEQIKFPITQLKGCRNYEECHKYCSIHINFPACVAWSHSR